jgi:hypothetical protein
MKDNSGHSEGGEVPKLTKEQAKKVEEGMDLWRGKEEKLTKGDTGYKYFTCPTCDGSGQISQDEFKAGSVAAPKPDEEVCPTCGNGWGAIEGRFCSNSWHLATPHVMRQVARLQSELAAANESIKELIKAGGYAIHQDILYRAKSLIQ